MNTRGEKIKPTSQWNEKSDAPIATRAMSPADIEEYRKALAMSYKCDISAIKYHFQKITDENDTDRDDCLWLKYTLDVEIAGKPGLRTVATLKMPIPENIRAEAERLRRQNASKAGAHSTDNSAAPTQAPSGPAYVPGQAPTRTKTPAKKRAVKK